MCRETVNSLAKYFVIFSFLSGFISIPFLFDPQSNILFAGLGCLSLGLAIAFLYLSKYLRKLLIEFPTVIYATIILRMLLGIVMSLIPTLGGSVPIVSILRIALTLWVGEYFLKQVQLVSLNLRFRYYYSAQLQSKKLRST